MSWFSRESVLGLVVALFLVTPLASAAQRPQEVRTAAARLSLPEASEMFVRAWRFVLRIWMEEGCRIDPHGVCLPEQDTGSGLDAGCRIDPHGACVLEPSAGSNVDNGCGIDPHGGCAASAEPG